MVHNSIYALNSWCMCHLCKFMSCAATRTRVRCSTCTATGADHLHMVLTYAAWATQTKHGNMKFYMLIEVIHEQAACAAWCCAALCNVRALWAAGLMPLHKRGPVDSICMAISPLMCEGTYAELTSQCPVRCRSISLRLTSSTHRAFNTRRSFASEPHSSKTSNVPAAKAFIYILERAHRSNKSKYHENTGRLRLNVAHAARVGAEPALGGWYSQF